MRRLPAYAKELVERRQNGERVGLAVVSLHDWKAGLWFDGRPEVVRVVVPADLPVATVDWSWALALDVVVCGAASDTDFYAACDALQAAGAASLWGEFADGVWLLERGFRLWSAVDGPVALKTLPSSLRLHRTVMMMLRRGFYGSRVFDAARSALLQQIKGVAA